ncbi:MAG: hypothetical protein WA775_00250 [Psychroserpens sp.]|uniref:hypothetical protein n=1 Tax=Psychroserpens sp. TaxID=2020870 RepID=UPI003C78936B
MQVVNLSFGTIHILTANIAEIIVNEGVLLDSDMVIAYRKIIEQELQQPCALLINKKNSYAHTFEAQITMGSLNNSIARRAVVVYGKNARMAMQIIIETNKHQNWNIEIFNTREAALDWLLTHQNNKNAI